MSKYDIRLKILAKKGDCEVTASLSIQVRYSSCVVTLQQWQIWWGNLYYYPLQYTKLRYEGRFGTGISSGGFKGHLAIEVLTLNISCYVSAELKEGDFFKSAFQMIPNFAQLQLSSYLSIGVFECISMDVQVLLFFLSYCREIQVK